MRRVACLAPALLLAVGFALSDARAAPNPEDTGRDFYATLVDAMRRGSQLGERGRYDALAPARARLSPEQQQSVTDAFARYMIATHADRFNGYSGEKFEVTSAQTRGFGTMVRSRIVRSNGDPVALNYLIRHNGDDWQIADVYLSGTVSQVATLRSQFSAVWHGRALPAWSTH